MTDIAKQKLRLEVHARDEAALRAEIEESLADKMEMNGEIIALRAENERLREALERIANSFDGETGDGAIARAALQSKGTTEGE